LSMAPCRSGRTRCFRCSAGRRTTRSCGGRRTAARSVHTGDGQVWERVKPPRRHRPLTTLSASRGARWPTPALVSECDRDCRPHRTPYPAPSWRSGASSRGTSRRRRRRTACAPTASCRVPA
jgi:hypothetical protein